VEAGIIDQLEDRSHPTLMAARKAGMETCWGNFSADGGEEYFLFIGKKIGEFGAEHQSTAILTKEGFLALASMVEAKLASLQITAGVGMYTAWHPDIS
jgi:hypothetical protein